MCFKLVNYKTLDINPSLNGEVNKKRNRGSQVDTRTAGVIKAGSLLRERKIRISDRKCVYEKRDDWT